MTKLVSHFDKLKQHVFEAITANKDNFALDGDIHAAIIAFELADSSGLGIDWLSASICARIL